MIGIGHIVELGNTGTTAIAARRPRVRSVGTGDIAGQTGGLGGIRTGGTGVVAFGAGR